MNERPNKQPAPTRKSWRERASDYSYNATLRLWRVGDVIRGDEVSPRARGIAPSENKWGLLGVLWAIVVILAAHFLMPPTPRWWMIAGLVIVLLPTVVLIAVVWLRQLLRADEMQQRIELLAMATTFIVVCSLFLLRTLLGDLGIAVPIPHFAGLAVLLAVYFGTRRILRWRYR